VGAVAVTAQGLRVEVEMQSWQGTTWLLGLANPRYTKNKTVLPAAEEGRAACPLRMPY